MCTTRPRQLLTRDERFCRHKNFFYVLRILQTAPEAPRCFKGCSVCLYVCAYVLVWALSGRLPSTSGLLLRPDREAEYCDERVCVCVRACVRACVCVCVCVSVRDYIFRTARPVFEFLCMLPMAVARSSSGSVVIRYVLPVLWMTSYLLISQGCSTSPPS